MAQKNKLISVVGPSSDPNPAVAGDGFVHQGLRNRLDTPESLMGLSRLDTSLPPAVMPSSNRPVPVNMRLFESSARAITDAALAQGTTQKVVIMRAVAAAGIKLDPRDLMDRTPRRRARE